MSVGVKRYLAEKYAELLVSGNEATRFAVLKDLMDRAYGKAKQKDEIAVTVSADSAAVIEVKPKGVDSEAWEGSVEGEVRADG